jgi:predicted DNA-binding transcriptional regulator AlpA
MRPIRRLRHGGEGPAQSRSAPTGRALPAGARAGPVLVRVEVIHRSVPRVRLRAVPASESVRRRQTREVDVHGGRRLTSAGHGQIAQGKHPDRGQHHAYIHAGDNGWGGRSRSRAFDHSPLGTRCCVPMLAYATLGRPACRAPGESCTAGRSGRVISRIGNSGLPRYASARPASDSASGCSHSRWYDEQMPNPLQGPMWRRTARPSLLRGRRGPAAGEGTSRDGRCRSVTTAARDGRSSTSRSRLTVADVCEELCVSRSTFYDWRAKGKAPRCIKLPNGEIRVRRDELDRWLASCEEVA